MAAVNFTGLASGIDSNALIKALIDSERQVRINPLQDKITEFQDTNQAFSGLKDRLSKLKLAASKLATINGSALQKVSNSSDESILSASASSSANNGSYAITVSSLAKNGTFGFKSLAQTYSSSDQAINSSINDLAPQADRTVSITTGTGSNQEQVDIVLTSSTSLSDFVSQFNNSSTKSTASLVNVGSSSSPDYRIVINSNSQGTDKGQLAVSIGSEITSAGSHAFDGNSLSQAENATLQVTGIGAGAGDTITRSSNSISDVIAGVNLQLQDTGSATLSIKDDSASSAQLIQNFVDAYNEVVHYTSENNLVTRQDDGTNATNTFGPLSSSSLDENLLSALRGGISGASISGHEINTLADLGVTTQRDGSLSFDSQAFSTALGKDSEAVRQISQKLGDALGTTGGTIDQFTRFNGLIDQESNSNNDQISALQSRISLTEKQLGDEEKALTARYAGLEKLVGQLNSAQTALSSLTGK